jgi:restriction system protein
MPHAAADVRRIDLSGESKIGADWEGDLEGWLAAIGVTAERDEDVTVQDWCFPTDALKNEYLATVRSRPEAEVIGLLRLFLFEHASFGADDDLADQLIGKGLPWNDVFMREYRLRLAWYRLMRHGAPHPGVRWALDLLGYNPKGAVDVIGAYTQAHFQVLPDGRIDGLSDAMAVIRARWLSESAEGKECLLALSPRDLEGLVAALSEKRGYTATLTPPQRDGGRDVVAVRRDPGETARVLVECKMYTRPVGVGLVRELLGVVDDEHANKGVMVTVSRFTRGARALAEKNSRIELIDGDALLKLLSETFGTTWFRDRDRLIRQRR